MKKDFFLAQFACENFNYGICMLYGCTNNYAVKSSYMAIKWTYGIKIHLDSSMTECLAPPRHGVIPPGFQGGARKYSNNFSYSQGKGG